jgi:hypothetical protein
MGSQKELHMTSKQYCKHLFQAEEILKALIMLMTHKAYFRELASNKKDAHMYENTIEMLIRLIEQGTALIAHLSAQLLHSFCRYPTPDEKKFEGLNKKIILSSRFNAIRRLGEAVLKRTLARELATQYNTNAFTFHLSGTLHVLEAYIYDRGETTSPEDMRRVLDFLNRTEVFVSLNVLSRNESLMLVYGATLCLNSTFKSSNSRPELKKLQNKILTTSTLMIYHINLAVNTVSRIQRQLSVIFLSQMLSDNFNACALLCRILPKPLFRRVPAVTNDIAKWDLQQWDEFFNIARQTFNTPNELWNDECRVELADAIREADNDFCSKITRLKLRQIEAVFNVAPGKALEIQEHHDDGQHEPSKTHQILHRLADLRGNHEEFEMRFTTHANKFLVWKYYLSVLLVDGPEPKLVEAIAQPLKFWVELNSRFLSTSNKLEQIKIMKTMILLYRDNYKAIRDLSGMHYWLKVLVDPFYEHVHYLVVQLLYTSIAIEDNVISRYNQKKLLEGDGLNILAKRISSIFFTEAEVQAAIASAARESLKKEIILDMKEERKHADIDELLEVERSKTAKTWELEMLYNYTNLKLTHEPANRVLEKLNIARFVLGTFKQMLAKNKHLDDEERYITQSPSSSVSHSASTSSPSSSTLSSSPTTL